MGFHENRNAAKGVCALATGSDLRFPLNPSRFTAATELVGLPVPVPRYFPTVSTDGHPIITASRVDHTGSFTMGQDTDQWPPFTSRQHIATRRPGLVRDARIAIMPGVQVRRHDACIGSEGILHPAGLRLVTLINLRGSGKAAQGELMRFFAETAWYPTTFLPRPGVVWAAIDDLHAQATVQDGNLSLTMIFKFSD